MARPASNSAFKPLWGLLIIILGVTAFTAIGKFLQPKEIIPWRGDFSAASDEARRGGKPVLAYFTADWCGPCQGLKHTTWADKGVESALRDYVPVKVDIDRSAALASKYEITSIPAFIVMRADGTPLKRTDGALNPEEFRAWLKG